MPLSDYQEPSVTLPIGATTVTLYPLSLPDIGVLRAAHFDGFLATFQRYAPQFGSGDEGQVEAALLSVLIELADAVACAISLAAREPHAAAIAKRLPPPVQIVALAEIWRLTAADGLFAPAFADQVTSILSAFPTTTTWTIN